MASLNTVELWRNDKMSFPGLSKPTPQTCAQGVMVMAGLIPAKKKRKPRSKETAPRRKEEAEFRRDVIKLLKKKGCRVWRIENGVTGGLGNGLPDLLVFMPIPVHGVFGYIGDNYVPPLKMVWVELKSSSGIMYIKEQIEFMECCKSAGVKHLVLRPGEDVWERIKNA